MARKKKSVSSESFVYSKNESFENLEAVQQMALNKSGKDGELAPDISLYLKAEELKGKLCGLYTEKDKGTSHINIMGSVKINGVELDVQVGESKDTDNKDDRIT